MGSAQTLKKHNNMPKFLLVDDIGEGLYVVATTKASCKDAAHNYFFAYCGFVSGEIIAESDYLSDMKNESELNALECQSNEQ